VNKNMLRRLFKYTY